MVGGGGGKARCWVRRSNSAMGSHEDAHFEVGNIICTCMYCMQQICFYFALHTFSISITMHSFFIRCYSDKHLSTLLITIHNIYSPIHSSDYNNMICRAF